MTRHCREGPEIPRPLIFNTSEADLGFEVASFRGIRPGGPAGG